MTEASRAYFDKTLENSAFTEFPAALCNKKCNKLIANPLKDDTMEIKDKATDFGGFCSFM